MHRTVTEPYTYTFPAPIVLGIFLGAFSAIACGNLFYQAHRIYGVSWSGIIAKILLFTSGILLAYEVCIFIYNNR
jgi:hypothetical protein